MRMFTRFACIIIAALFFVNTASAQLNSQLVRESDDGKTFTVSQGTQIDVLLDMNTPLAATWKVRSVSGTAVKLRNQEEFDGDFVRPDGSFAATYEGVFRTVRPGTSVIEFIGLDASGKATTKSFTVTVVVKP